MGQSALLEREYQSFKENEDNTPEAIAHRKRGSEIYNSVFQSKEVDAEKIAAAFSVSASAAKTAEAPVSASVSASVSAPVSTPVSTPVMTAPAVTEAPARRDLFSDMTYKDHTLVHTGVKEETAPEVAPSFSPVDLPAQETASETAPETEENEDLRPTRRTMETLQREELYRQAFAIEQQQRERVGFFASLSSKTKMVLAILSALFVVAIALVCINTGLINSMKSGLQSKEAELQRLSQYSDELEGNIERFNDPAFVDDYAEHELGMTRS